VIKAHFRAGVRAESAAEFNVRTPPSIVLVIVLKTIPPKEKPLVRELLTAAGPAGMLGPFTGAALAAM
jgi:hypothetical protein